MDKKQDNEGTLKSDIVAAEATASLTPIRQEEQSQQSQQEADYPTVDFGSCWYHEDAVKTGSK